MESEYAICPFNSQHKILRFRLPAHIIKCKKNYNGPILKVCPFNATHFVPPEEMPAHLKTCAAYAYEEKERHFARPPYDD